MREILSNRESGDGFSDILIKTKGQENPIGIVIELKYSENEKLLDKDCRDALQQIEDRDYGQELRNHGYQKILKYGIAFYQYEMLRQGSNAIYKRLKIDT